MKRRFFIYDAFTNEIFKGNPAGILLDSKELTSKTMQLIAKEIGYPETVFLEKNDNDKIKVKFFTPKEEIDLCGHATIAYSTALFENNIIDFKEGENIIKVETNLGELPIIINTKGKNIENIMMYQASPKIDKNFELKKEELAKLLNVNTDDFDENIEIVKAYTGVWDLMIPVKSKEILDNININIEEVKELSKELEIISLHVFYIDEVTKKVYARNFAPIVDIIEEAATGTSNGALIYYLYTINEVEENTIVEIIQGESLGRRSQILGKVLIEDGKVDVLIGGKAIKFSEGIIDL